MTPQSPTIDMPFTVVEGINLVALHPGEVKGQDVMLAATRESIAVVFRDFLALKELSHERLAIPDGFLFVFNDPKFFTWKTLNWWQQRQYIQAIKDSSNYRERARILLSKSGLAPYMEYSDDMVAKSTEQEVKRAWMRKRLVLKECFWNAIDAISHVAYHRAKYQDMYPALCVLLCNITETDGRTRELVLGIDNGSGYLYKKKSKESTLFHFLYLVYKFFFRRGVFYIGGLELGLLETESELSCHGSGAVVYQGW
jgi:hypothetical protein